MIVGEESRNASNPEEARRVEEDTYSFLRQQDSIDADRDILEDLGYPEMARPSETSNALTLEEKVKAATSSGEMLVTREVAAPPSKDKAQSGSSSKSPKPKYEPPKATRSRDKAARDMGSGAARKPWPYGSMED